MIKEFTPCDERVYRHVNEIFIVTATLRKRYLTLSKLRAQLLVQSRDEILSITFPGGQLRVEPTKNSIGTYKIAKDT